MDLDFDEEGEEITQKKGTAKGQGKKSSKNNKTVVDNKSAATSDNNDSADPSERRKSISVEQKYQKMTQREHIIKRPDTYSYYHCLQLMYSWQC